AASVAEPAIIQQQVVEEIVVERQGVRRDVTASIAIPQRLRWKVTELANAQNYCLAVAFRDVRAPVDSLEILDCEGHQLRVLEGEELLHLVRTTINVLLRLAYDLTAEEMQPLPPKVLSLSHAALEQIAKPSANNARGFELADLISHLEAPSEVYLHLAATLVS